MTKIVNIFDIIDNYDILLFDIWGVLMEQQPYKEAIEAVKKINRMKDIYIVTNMGRTRETVRQKLLDKGLEIDLHKIFTAGETTRSLLKNKKPNGKNPVIYHFDERFNEGSVHHELLDGVNITTTKDLNEANLILISQFADHQYDCSKFDSELNEAAKRKLEALCSNPDTVVVNEGQIRYCAGFFAEKYEDMGGNVHYAGKPYLNIYDEVFASIKNINEIDKNRILMVGDTLETDILGAKNAQIHSALVTTGNMSKLLWNMDISKQERYNLLLDNAKSAGLVPEWIIEIK
jgi:HAD superfamily hydrolase (TIGR01459 family)